MTSSPPTPTQAALQQAVGARYQGLAAGAANLSCGAALDLAAPGPGEALLDLGCGRGRDLARAVALVGPMGRVYGVDGSPAMLDRAREAVPAGATNVTLLHGDLAAVGLPDGVATVVISNCAINHAADKGAVYREIHRLLRAGGRFVVSDVVSLQPLPEAVRRDPEAWAACYGGAIPEAEYLAAIRQAGFGTLEVLARTEPYEKGGVLVRSLTVKGSR